MAVHNCSVNVQAVLVVPDKIIKIIRRVALLNMDETSMGAVLACNIDDRLFGLMPVD